MLIRDGETQPRGGAGYQSITDKRGRTPEHLETQTRDTSSNMEEKKKRVFKDQTLVS